MALRGGTGFLFICAEVSTYRKEKKVRNGGPGRGYAEGRDQPSVLAQFLVIDSSHWHDTMIDRPSTPPISLLSPIHPVLLHIGRLSLLQEEPPY